MNTAVRAESAGPAEGLYCDISVVSTDAQLNELEGEWNILLQESQATVFQSFEWISACWKYFHGRSTLHCLAFRSDGRLVGLAPLCRRRVRLFFRVCTVLEFIGRPHGDYNDFIALPGYERAVVRAFVHHFASGEAHADALDLDEIPTTSPLKLYLAEEAQMAHLDLVVQPGPVCPYIPLPASFEEFLAALGPNTRYNYRRKWSKLSDSHKTAERFLHEPGEDLNGGITSFMRIHSDRWKGLGFPSVFDKPVHRSFISEVSHRFAVRDWLRLYLLEVDGIDVAASLEFAHHGRIYMYNSNASGAPEVMKQSPGLLVKISAIRQGISEHMREYDMLRGEETYKYDHLKALERFNTTMRLAAPSATGRMRFRLYLLWLFLKKVIGRTRLEYHEWRRFAITKQPGIKENINYFARRAAKVTHMAVDFFAVYFRRRSNTSGA